MITAMKGRRRSVRPYGFTVCCIALLVLRKRMATTIISNKTKASLRLAFLDVYG